MASRASIRTELRQRLGDSGSALWSDPELNGFIDYAIKGLYPAFYQRKVAITTASAGPLQVAPAGARNIYMLAHQRATSTRARPARGWQEGDGYAFLPKTGITGDTLVWSWTEGWDAPASDTETLALPVEAEEVVLIRAHIAALENLLSDRVRVERFHALHVRQGTTEEDVVAAIDALHASLRDRLERVVPLPEVQR